MAASNTPVTAPAAVTAVGAKPAPASMSFGAVSVPRAEPPKAAFSVAPASPPRGPSKSMSVDGMKTIGMPQTIVM